MCSCYVAVASSKISCVLECKKVAIPFFISNSLKFSAEQIHK